MALGEVGMISDYWSIPGLGVKRRRPSCAQRIGVYMVSPTGGGGVIHDHIATLFDVHGGDVSRSVCLGDITCAGQFSSVCGKDTTAYMIIRYLIGAR